MRKITVAAVQMRCEKDRQANLKKAEKMIRKAAEAGANVILLPELFEREYFCQQRCYEFYQYAEETNVNAAVQKGIR